MSTVAERSMFKQGGFQGKQNIQKRFFIGFVYKFNVALRLYIYI